MARAKPRPSWVITNVSWDVKKTIWQHWAQGDTVIETLRYFELHAYQYENAPLHRDTIKKAREELSGLPAELVRKLVEEMPEVKGFVLERRPDLKEQLEPLEQAANWIDAHEKQHGKLPPMPDCLLPLAPEYSPGEPISKEIQLIMPSMQLWANLLPSQREQLLKLVEWLGQDPQDYIERMRRQAPPSGRFPPLRWKR